MSVSAERVFDVVVIGAGPGGEDLTTLLLRQGMTVALVESELLGGECFNWACVPSKAMLRVGHAVRAAGRLPGAEAAAATPVDADRALARRDDIVLHHDDAVPVRDYEDAGATFVRGHGHLDGPRRVVVDGPDGTRLLGARQAVVVATGSTTAFPAIPGLADAQPWTNREATSASRVPRRLVVLGSGAVGLELAQAWKSLGSEEIVVLSRGASLLPALPPFAGELVLDGLRETGVDVRFGAHVSAVSRDDDEVRLELDDGETLRADEILVATGKAPALAGLGLETVGVDASGFLGVDDMMQVLGVPGLYAIGDVNGRALLTHQASYHARVAGAAIIARSRGAEPTFLAEADHDAVPQVIFTDPAVAAVGLSVAGAQERGLTVRVRQASFGSVLGAELHARGYTGTASIVIDQGADVIVGATFVGQDVADLLHAATVAIVGRVPLSRLRHAIPSFPTLSEIWLELLDG